MSVWHGGTEPPFSGKYYNCWDAGTYCCVICGMQLFASDDKFDSGTGWPSFTRAVAVDSVQLLTDRSHHMVRTEVRCSQCGSHLGHVFPDGPPPSGLRFCINSGAMDLKRR